MLDPESPLERGVDRLGKWPLLARVADVWQPIVASTLKQLGTGVTDALHGTPLGHPLHPLLTDIPVGAWTVTALLDGAELVGRGELSGGADAALAIGIAGASAAAVTGYADWSDTEGESKNLGMAHAALNGAALTAYVASLVLRRTGRRGAGIALSMGGYALLTAAGYLGGELAFGLQLGVKHTGAPVDPPGDFVPAIAASAVAEGKMKRVTVNDLPLLLYRAGGDVYAISDICTHRGGPLSEGRLKDGCVQCPWHGSTFRLESGDVVTGPAVFPQPRYETRTVDGTIEVRASQPS